MALPSQRTHSQVGSALYAVLRINPSIARGSAQTHRARGPAPRALFEGLGGTLHRQSHHRPVEENPPVLLVAEQLTRHATGEIAIIGLALAALIGVLGGFLLTLDRRR
jgi:hypothetical protein